MPELLLGNTKWELGRHTLLYGDATNPEHLNELIGNHKIALVLQDPPYGIDIYHQGGHLQGKGKKAYQVYTEFLGDEDDNAARKNYELIKHIKKIIIWGGQFFRFLPISQGWLGWNKIVNIDNYSAFELAWTSFLRHNKIYSHRWCGYIKQGSKTLNPIPRIHPTQKPTELYMSFIEEFTDAGDIVLDCFAGSGTTIIACEETGRTCLSMELSEHYCNKIVERWNNYKEAKERKKKK